MVINCGWTQWIDVYLTMRLFWWQQLPSLIIIRVLEPSSINHKIYAEALLACKSTLDSPRQSSGRIGRYPCIRQWACLSCYILKDPGVSLRITAMVDGNNAVPIIMPVQQGGDKKPGKQRVAAIVGGVGAALLVIGFVVLVYICLMHVKRSIRRTSERESSEPSPSGSEEFGDLRYFGASL